MKRGIPRSWTQRLSRWTGHQTNVPSQTPKQDTNDYVADVKSLANNTVVTASEKGTKEDARTFEYVNSAGEQLFVTTNCAGIDTDDATEKRFGTIERKIDKETPNQPTDEQTHDDIPGSVKREPLNTSDIETERLDERNPYASVKKYKHNV